jgi:hypothetical protein
MTRRGEWGVVFVLAAGCARSTPAAPWSPPEDPIDARAFAQLFAHTDSATRDGATRDGAQDGAMSATRRCVRLALPPTDLLATPKPDGGVSIAWSGRTWGITWTESADSADAIFFVTVGQDGRRRDTPVRVTDRGMRGRHPFLVWNNDHWLLFSSGGLGRFDEIWVHRLDARGLQVVASQRVTSRDRHDHHPTARRARDGGWLLAWASEVEPRRHEIHALRLGGWGQQLAAPSRLVERTARLTEPVITSRGDQFIILWTAMRQNSFAIEGARLDAGGALLGGVVRILSAPLGLAERSPRAALTCARDVLSVAWEQWEHGSSGVRVARFPGRLGQMGEPEPVLDSMGVLRAPALESIDERTLILATQRSVGEMDQSVLLSIREPDGSLVGEPVMLRGHEGLAERPLLSIGAGTIAVLTQGPRGLALHRVPLVECGEGGR